MGSRSRGSSRLGWLVIVGVLVFLGTCTLHAQETMQVTQSSPGFSAYMQYQDLGKGESVNLSNGGLTVTHPSALSLPQNMGGVLCPTRVYNTKTLESMWLPSSTDLACGILGKGWTLSAGRVHVIIRKHQIYGGYNFKSRAYFYYQDETGAEHHLYRMSSMENWNDTSNPATSGWYLTADGSYLRAYFTSGAYGGTWTIYSPDGSTRSAGGTSDSYIQPTVGGKVFNTNPQDGTYFYKTMPNFHQAGWYVTQITDRANACVQRPDSNRSR